MPSHYAFLRPRFPALVQLLDKTTEQYRRADYEASVSNLRKFSEQATKLIFDLNGWAPPARDRPEEPRPRIIDWQKMPVFQETVPRGIQRAIHRLRELGNRVAHEVGGHDATLAIEAKLALIHAFQIAAYLHDLAGGDPGHVPAEPLPPTADPPAPAEQAPPRPPRSPEPAGDRRTLERVLEALRTEAPGPADHVAVDAAQSGPRALQDALDGAAAPASLRLTGGRHALREILRSVDLVGPAELILPAEGAVVASTGSVSLREVTVTGGGLTIVAGAVQVVDCTIRAPLHVTGSRARFSLQDSDVTGASLRVDRGAQAHLSGVSFGQAAGDTVTAASGAEVALTDCEVIAAGGSGLRAVEARIVARDCTLSDCAVGASTGPGGLVELHACRLGGNGQDLDEASPGSIRT